MSSPTLKRVVPSISAHAWNGAGTMVAICPNNEILKIYDAKSWKVKYTLKEHTGIIKFIDWSPKGDKSTSNDIFTISFDLF